MKENQTTEPKCPSFEDISAFLDNELTPDSPAGEHISHCPKCLARLESYRQTDKLIRRNSNVEVPEGLNDRIKAAIAREERVLHFPAHWGLIWRLAAAFTVCASVAFYALVNEEPSHTITTNSEETIRSLPAKPIRPSTEPAHHESASNYNAPRLNEMISAGSLVGASYGGSEMPVFTDAMASIDRNRKPVDIASQVQQVWSVQNIAQTTGIINNVLKKMNIPPSNIRMTEDGKSLKLMAGLTKLELVNLVRLCKSEGMELLSPSAPQPEQNVFIGNSAGPVVYYAEFVVQK